NTLDDMITLLGTNHGRVIQLKLQGFTLREIAKEMGISKTAAGEYFKEAKQTLRRTLGSWR
ncbi:MAG: sigma-70 family RNA polymerase sigma factor, partial [Planctomycetales bacterium]|nr:sigma-70 family RNA polymerase sigma factor [Planctomycetales bacterium]